MKSGNETVSFCRHCRLYRSEGRRGGHCQQLGVPVQGSWKACSLAVAPFSSSWKELVEMAAWQTASSNPQAEIALEVPLPISLTEAGSVIAVTLPVEEALLGID